MGGELSRMDKKSYRIDEVAKEFDVCNRTVERWIRAGELDAVKIGHTRRITSEQLAEIKKKERQLATISDNYRHIAVK